MTTTRVIPEMEVTGDSVVRKIRLLYSNRITPPMDWFDDLAEEYPDMEYIPIRIDRVGKNQLLITPIPVVNPTRKKNKTVKILRQRKS